MTPHIEADAVCHQVMTGNIYDRHPIDCSDVGAMGSDAQVKCFTVPPLLTESLGTLAPSSDDWGMT